MIIMIKTDKQLKVPKWSKNEINRWADYIELRCLYMDDHLVSKDDVLDIFIDEDLDELQRGEAEHSLKYDKLSSVIGNYYEIIKYRKSKHPEYYPFDIEDDRCIVLKDNLENKHLHYDEWINKQESINSDTWRTRIDPIAPFWRYMYVPFYCHNASGKFEQLTDIHTCLIDRQRILCLLDLHHELFEQLESLQLQVLINNIW